MPNVLDAAPIDTLARRMAAKIPNQGAAIRFAKLAFEEMLRNRWNFRPALPGELASAAAWARREQEGGGQVVVFLPDRAGLTRLRRIARALADTCLEIDHVERSLAPGPAPRPRALHLAAIEFIAKIDRASFDIVATKARLFARERKRRLDEQRATLILFADEEIFAAPGRVWRRVVSVCDLWALGREFRNCLARRSIGGYARRLSDGSAQFWVLRDQTGKGLIIAMVCMDLQRVVEARGPFNRTVDADDPDLVRLGQARNWRRPNGASSTPPAPADAAETREILIGLLRARGRQPI